LILKTENRKLKTAARVLVRAPNWLGDNVLALPAVAALCRLRPSAHVTVLVRDSMADFWRMTPVHEVMPLHVRTGMRGLADRWRLAQLVRRRAFDSALILPNSFDSALVPWLARIPCRAGWASDARGLLLTQRVPRPANWHGENQSQRYIHLVGQFLGERVTDDTECRLQTTENVVCAVQARRAALAKLLLGLNPGATYGSAKCWLPERFAEVAMRAHGELGAGVIIVGGPGDARVCGLVAELIARQAPDATTWCLNLAGQTSLCELTAWLRECRCVVTNDTGGMHLAAAAGTRVVAIFGPTDWRETAPLGEGHVLLRGEAECAPCCKRECVTDHRCMTSVSVEQVWQTVQAMAK
jgi:heptosyltransferase-2